MTLQSDGSHVLWAQFYFLWLLKVKDASSGQNQNQQLNDQETILLHSLCEAAEAFSTWTHKLTHAD